MSVLLSPQRTPAPPISPSPGPGPGAPRRRRGGAASGLLARGEPMVWIMGAGLALCLVMIVGLLAFVFYEGTATFWPGPVTQVKTVDGRTLMGEVARTESYRPGPEVFEALPDGERANAEQAVAAAQGLSRRRMIRTGNFELTNEHFTWVSDFELSAGGESRPEWAVLFERRAWGRFYGAPTAFLIDGAPVATDPDAVWRRFNEIHAGVVGRWRERGALEKDDTGRVNHALEEERLRRKRVELKYGAGSPQWKDANERFLAKERDSQVKFDGIRQKIDALNGENSRYAMSVVTADGTEKLLAVDEIVRAFPPNRLGLSGKTGVYFSRWREFLFDEPREANSEGGVFPAIFGTVVMTLLMSLAVVPFGVLAALYIREYAKAGLAVSAVRIAINNLAGVPSIVFGVFGLGFFSYIIGANIDQWLFAEKLPNPTLGTGGILWASLTLALLTLPVVIVSTEEALAAVPNSMREGSYACGASKWQTIRRIVLPRAMPGVITGLILAMARGAGEVAPLMLVGAVKLAPELPLDGYFPYVHLERSFMHLGFHIYDLGFQSQNSEASKPMVFTTTLLLIAIIFVLNFLGVLLRARLRRKFSSSVF
jgi:phosphate transport system permease protein